MYPSKDSVFYGIFVKNFVEQMMNVGVDIDRVVIKGRSTNKLAKLIKYLTYIIFASYKIIFSKQDLIYIHGASLSLLPIVLLKKIIKVPIVINVHGNDVATASITTEGFASKYFTKTIETADLVVFPSHDFMEKVNKKYRIKKSFVSPSGGINLGIFSKKSNNKKKKKLGFISRFDEGKGWDTLVEAINSLQNNGYELKLIMVGSGEQEKNLRDLIKRYRLEESITIYPPMRQEELVDIYCSVDAFVFPSRREGESLGLVGLEAMACCTPVIGSDIPGIGSYLESGVNGLTFEANSFEDLSEKIMSFYDLSLEQIDEMKKNAYLTATKFDSEKIASELQERLESIL
jgi:glycosyltransferase involved in cell wall biosynthesis